MTIRVLQSEHAYNNKTVSQNGLVYPERYCQEGKVVTLEDITID